MVGSYKNQKDFQLVLGVDPGTTTTGYAIAKIGYNSGKIVKGGVIETKANVKLGEKLLKIYKEVKKILSLYRPHLVGIESLFFFKNKKTAIEVSQARGVVFLAVYQQKIPVIEVTPLEVKTAICGFGRATKYQVGKMVQTLFYEEKPFKPDDYADAVAIAWAAVQKFNNFRNTEGMI